MHRIRTPRRRMLTLIAAAILANGIALTGCTTSTPEATSPSPSSTHADGFLATHDLAGLDATQIIDRLDTTLIADRPTDLMASVRPNELVLSADQGQELTLPMPPDTMYISIAPYQTTTHDCYNHSLTACLGELRNTPVQVTLTDNHTGEVLVDETKQTFDNGFVGLWVPRDIKATLTITREGKTAAATLSTTDNDDPTCITTLHLT